MHRIVIAPAAVQGSRIVVEDPKELHHLVDVLRVQVGERIQCLDGQGRSYLGTVVRCQRRALTLDIAQRMHEAGERPRLGLAQALIRPERFEWIVQKATELGVDRLTPLVTARSVVRPVAERMERQHSRWQRIAREATKQCGRSTSLEVEPPCSLDRFLEGVDAGACVLLPTLSVTGAPIVDALQGLREGDAVTVMIGPEGDFARQEVERAQRAGARPVSLGPLTLRAETAALVAVTLVQWARTRVSAHNKTTTRKAAAGLG